MKVELDEKDFHLNKQIEKVNQKYEFILSNLSEENDQSKATTDSARKELENKNLKVLKGEEQLKQLSGELNKMKDSMSKKCEGA